MKGHIFKKKHIAKVGAALALRQEHIFLKKTLASPKESTVGSCHTFLQECCALCKQESTLSNVKHMVQWMCHFIDKGFARFEEPFGPSTVRLHSFQNHAVVILTDIQSWNTTYYIFLQEGYEFWKLFNTYIGWFWVLSFEHVFRLVQMFLEIHLLLCYWTEHGIYGKIRHTHTKFIPRMPRGLAASHVKRWLPKAKGLFCSSVIKWSVKSRMLGRRSCVGWHQLGENWRSEIWTQSFSFLFQSAFGDLSFVWPRGSQMLIHFCL